MRKKFPSHANLLYQLFYFDLRQSEWCLLCLRIWKAFSLSTCNQSSSISLSACYLYCQTVEKKKGFLGGEETSLLSGHNFLVRMKTYPLLSDLAFIDHTPRSCRLRLPGSAGHCSRAAEPTPTFIYRDDDKWHVKSEADRRRKRFRLTHQHDYLLEKSRFVSQLKCWLRKRFKYEKKKKEKKPAMFSHLLINAAGQSVTVGGIAQKKFITWGYLKCLKCATATPNPFAHTFTFPNHRGIDAVWFAHHNSSRLVFARWFCADALYNSWPQWPCEHRQVWLQTTWLRHNIWSMT